MPLEAEPVADLALVDDERPALVPREAGGVSQRCSQQADRLGDLLVVRQPVGFRRHPLDGGIQGVVSHDPGTVAGLIRQREEEVELANRHADGAAIEGDPMAQHVDNEPGGGRIGAGVEPSDRNAQRERILGAGRQDS